MCIKQLKEHLSLYSIISIEMANKIYEPGECMKYMNIEAHPNLLGQWYMSDVPREVTVAKATVVPALDLYTPELLVWSRTVPRTLDADDGQVKLSDPTTPCKVALYICTAESLCEHITEHTLSPYLQELQQIVDSQLSLVIFGTKEYFRSSRRKTSNSNRANYTELNLEMAVADLLVTAGCDTVLVNTPNELALLIVQYTKAIAEAPYKKAKHACDEQADFYMRGDNKKCVAIDKSGAGVARLWQQMLAVLPHSSLETSRALCAEYKSPLELFNACQEPNSVTKISDIGVSRAAVPGAKARRVGPEMARKLHLLFTATDPNTVLE